MYGDETFDGTNYINSGIPLFSSDNIHRDFEVRSTISNFVVNPGQDTNRNALICNQNEVGEPFPGFALSYREDKDIEGGKAIKIQGNCTATAQVVFLWGKESGTIVITRTDDKLYYDDNIFLVDYADEVTPFNAPLTFGANVDKNGNPRRYSKIGGGEFILCFSVGLDFIIRNYDYIVENNDLNGILNIIYYIESSNYDDDEAFLGDDDNWEY